MIILVQEEIKIVIRLEGRAKVAFTDGEKLDGFFKEGVLHGFARWGEEDGSCLRINNRSRAFPVFDSFQVLR